MKGKIFKQLTASFVALAMIGSSLPAELADGGLFGSSAITASAEEQTAYTYKVYSWDYAKKKLKIEEETITSYVELTADIRKPGTEYADGLRNGTYVVTKNTTVEDHLYIRKGCTVNLIVPKGVTLTCNKGIGCGYDGKEYSTLNIYGEGKIVANGMKYAAGIGGKDDETNGSINIHGTEIEATGGHHGAGIGGGEGGQDPDASSPTITIYAGKITANGGTDGAGIGGGDCQPGARTYIYGGDITASSEKHGAGIGGGDDEGTYGIWIYNSTVNATGGHHGAGIGAGEEGGNLRDKSNGGGINILGGTVTATGGSGGAGIGGGYDEDMSGTIDISGVDTKITANGGYGSAGIGAGKGDSSDWCVPEGDMKGTITIECGEQSDIKVTGGGKSGTHEGGAGIGAGFAGNMTGKVYIKGGNIEITSGDMAAGIGGGRESGKYGGEGGDVYIGGGNITINTINSFWYYEDKSHAIGCGVEDAKDGSVYISADNNTTGKYMRVAYMPYDKDEFKTASASDRSKKTHTRCTLVLRECDHRDYNQPETDESQKGLTTTITPTQHIKKCKYCEYTEQGAHDSDTYCHCGYSIESNQNTVYIERQSGSPAEIYPMSVLVASGNSYEIPECDKKPTGKRFIGWALNGNTTNLKQPGDIITVNSNVTLIAQYADLYRILKDTSVPNGWIDASTYSADADDMITVRSVADEGYRLSSVTVKAGDENDEVLISKEIDEGDSFTFPMPPQDIYITAEFEAVTYSVKVTASDHGTVTADETVFTYTELESGSKTVNLTVIPEQGYYLGSLLCKTESGEGVVPQKVDDTHYTFEMPKENVTVSAEFEEDENAQSYISSASVSVDGEIGINLYIKLGNLIGDGAYVMVKGPNDTDARKVELTDSIFDNKQQAYKVSCPVYAPQMGEKVEFTLYNSNGDRYDLWNSAKTTCYEVYKYSVNDYIETAKSNANGDYNLKQLVGKMQNFGACARDSLIANNQISSDTAEIAAPVAVTGVDASTFESKQIEKGSGFVVEGLSISLFLDSETALRVYYTGDKINGITAKHGDETVDLTPGTSRDMNYVEIKNISAYNLGDDYVITFGDKGTLKVSPYSYCYLVMKNSNDVKLQNTVKALYEYCEAAKIFFSKN